MDKTIYCVWTMGDTVDEESLIGIFSSQEKAQGYIDNSLPKYRRKLFSIETMEIDVLYRGCVE